MTARGGGHGSDRPSKATTAESGAPAQADGPHDRQDPEHDFKGAGRLDRVPCPSPERIFSTLLSAYGRQGWWPVSGAGEAAAYRPGFFGPLSESEKTEIALGAILTQNTAWPNVERALSSLRRARVTSLSSVLKFPPSRLEALIRPAGYFRQKTRKLKAFARHVLEAQGETPRPLSRYLALGPLARLREDLLSVWGVGPETADSILLYAGGLAVFVVDAYTLRISKRLGLLSKESYSRAQELFTHGLRPRLRTAEVFNEFHALLVEHAKRHCRTRPMCAECPLLAMCAYGKKQKETEGNGKNGRIRRKNK